MDASNLVFISVNFTYGAYITKRLCVALCSYTALLSVAYTNITTRS